MPSDPPSERNLERSLPDLARRHDASASRQNQALHTVLFFYREVLGQTIGNINSPRAKRPVHARHAPTVTETQLLLQTIRDVGGYPTNLIARLLYGCGLRISEPLNLRVKDLNLAQFRLCIRGAKGGSDRFVALPVTLVAEIKKQLERARVIWQQDKQDGMPLMGRVWIVTLQGQSGWT
jgi:integrase